MSTRTRRNYAVSFPSLLRLDQTYLRKRANMNARLQYIYTPPLDNLYTGVETTCIYHYLTRTLNLNAHHMEGSR